MGDAVVTAVRVVGVHWRTWLRTAVMLQVLAGLVAISTDHLLKLANRADLMRISSIGTQHADLLASAGVGTGQELDIGRRGGADELLVHGRADEDKFVAQE